MFITGEKLKQVIQFSTVNKVTISLIEVIYSYESLHKTTDIFVYKIDAINEFKSLDFI